MADYQFKYSPLTGRITGKQMLEQTEQAINALASQVDSAAGQVEIISTLANEANENAATALEVANEALATTGRTYITVSTQTDANNYYDSQLIYIADSTSTNIPVADTGMLEVKTNDNKTICEQVFISDSSGDAYYRHGDITAETVGDVTTYSVTWGGWSSQPASQAYVQGELANYLPLSGGTVSGDLTVSGDITGGLTGNVTGLASGNLPLAGGTMSGTVVHSNSTAIRRDVDNDSLVIEGASAYNKGAYLQLYGKDSSNSAASFALVAHDGTNNPTLNGYPNGTLKWAGKEIERVNASGTNYIRYENGLQIVYARISVSMSGAESTGTPSSYTYYKYRKAYYYNLPVAFVDDDNMAFANVNESVNYWLASVNYCSSTQALIRIMGDNNTSTQIVSFIAIGRWK